ncbi:putative ribonuclease H-like domain-containing protein [Tanacetum coccineum]
MADDEVPTNMALMAFSDYEVHNDKTCSKICLKSFETLKTQLDDLRIEFNKSEFNLATYKRGLTSVEEQLFFYRKNEVIFCEQLVVLKRDISYKNLELSMLKSELEKLKQEKESNQLKIENFNNAFKSLDKLIGSQIPDKSRKGLGFVSYNVVPPPPTRLFSPPNLDFSNSGLEEFQQPEFEGYGPKTSKNVSEDTSNEEREIVRIKRLHDDLEVNIAKLVLLNGNSFKPAAQTTTNADGTSTTLIPGPVTTEEKVQKKNDVKARSMLLMALPNEHLLTFNQYKDAKTLFAAIQTRFDGNEATKKTQKTLLKQMYKNFSAPSTESIDSIFNRLQKINTHVVVWRNKPDLDTMSFDDLYNNFKIIEQELALLSMRTRRFFQKTGRKITINGSDTTGYDKSKVECFNCHKMGHFARECRGPRNQDSRNRNQDNSRRTINVKETSSKAMVAIDGAGFDWSYMADDEVPTNMLEKLKQEKESNQLKIENFDNASKSLDKLIGSQIPDKSRKGVGFVSYNAVSPPYTGLFSPPKHDLYNSGLEEFQQPEFEGYGPKSSKSVSEDISNKVRESPDAPLVEELVSNDKLEKKTVFPTVAKIEFANCNYHQRKRVGFGNIYTMANYNYSTKKAHTSATRTWPNAVNTARPNTTVVNAVRANQTSRNLIDDMLPLGEESKEGKLLVKELLKLMCDKKNNILFTDIGCFVLSPDFKLADESQVLLRVHRKNNMYSVDMKSIVPKEILTWKVTQSLFLMKKKYCLVVTDDYSRFTWVFFLATKDETSGILKSFITEVENLVDKKVNIIRCDNETEFKNRVMSEFYEKKGIKKEFSVARTPQQNGVAERINRTIIEVARTMLADSKLRTTFWAEAVNTACYVQNRVLVVKHHKKTPYELFRGRTPALSFMRPFSKAFRVYNIRIRKVEKNLHVRFLEDKNIITGDGPKWLFDIDVLTKSMNYVPVVAGTNSNDSVGTKDCIGAGHSSKEIGSSQDYILMPLWKNGSLFDSSSNNASNDEPQPSSDAGKKDDEGVSKESGINDQERPENCTQDVNTVGPSINTASKNVNIGSLNINIVSPIVTIALLEATHADFFGDEIEVDMSHITTTYPVSSTPNTRIHKAHSLDHVIRDVHSSVQTRRMTKTTNEQGFISAVYKEKTHEDLQNCLFGCFLSQVEPKKVIQALTDPSWIEAMHDELLQFKLQKVWILVDLPYGKRAIGTKWVYRNKKDKRGIVIRNKESAFMYGKIEEEVYVCQPLGFKDPEFPSRVYKVEKALYGLHHAPRAWYETLSTYLLDNEFQRGQIDKTLFMKRVKGDILLVQMSSMGELTFFLGLQVTQKDDGIFISQDKYADEILKKFGFSTIKTSCIPMETSKPLLKDAEAEDVDVYLYRSMIGSLMYLTAFRLDIMFVVCACARFQVTPKVSHLHAVKRISRYLKGQPKLGIWYPKDSPFDLEAYTDSDYAGASLDRKSTTRGVLS